MDRVKKYLDKAAECLDEARNAAPHLKAHLIQVAEQYTRLAEFAAKERDANFSEFPVEDAIEDPDEDE